MSIGRETPVERERREDDELRRKYEIAARPETQRLLKQAADDGCVSGLVVSAHDISISFHHLPVVVAQRLLDVVAEMRLGIVATLVANGSGLSILPRQTSLNGMMRG